MLIVYIHISLSSTAAKEKICICADLCLWVYGCWISNTPGGIAFKVGIFFVFMKFPLVFQLDCWSNNSHIFTWNQWAASWMPPYLFLWTFSTNFFHSFFDCFLPKLVVQYVIWVAISNDTTKKFKTFFSFSVHNCHVWFNNNRCCLLDIANRVFYFGPLQWSCVIGMQDN